MRTIHPLLKARRAVGGLCGWVTIFLIDLKRTVFIYLLLYVCACWGAQVEIRRRQLTGLDFLLPPRGPQGSKRGSQAWQQAHLPIKPLCLRSSVSEFADPRLALAPGDPRDLIHSNLSPRVAQLSPDLSLCILGLPNASGLGFC